MREPKQESALYVALRSYVVDGTSIDRGLLQELAKDGRSMVRYIGKSGIALASPEAIERLNRLKRFTADHGEPAANAITSTARNVRKYHG